MMFTVLRVNFTLYNTRKVTCPKNKFVKIWEIWGFKRSIVLEKSIWRNLLNASFTSTCPECFFSFALLTGVPIHPKVLFQYELSWVASTKQSICTFGLGEMYSPSLSNVGGQRWISAVTAHRERPPTPPARRPALLPNCLPGIFPQVLTFIFQGEVFVKFSKSARPWVGSEVKIDLSTLFCARHQELQTNTNF